MDAATITLLVERYGPTVLGLIVTYGPRVLALAEASQANGTLEQDIAGLLGVVKAGAQALGDLSSLADLVPSPAQPEDPSMDHAAGKTWGQSVQGR